MPQPYEMAPLADLRETNAITNPDNSEMIDDGLTSRKPKPEQPSYPPTGNPEGPMKPAIPNVAGRRPLDYNLYATKKTVAQGMMDLALLTANSNQLRYVLESGGSGAYFYISVTLISLSIFLQLIVGVGLVFIGRYNVSRDSQVLRAERLNNFLVLGILFITVLNIFISAFGIRAVEEIDPVLLINAYKESLVLPEGTTEKLKIP